MAALSRVIQGRARSRARQQTGAQHDHPLRRHPLCLALGAALGLQAPLVAAQIEEVVVTAQKREESLQTTPIAISAMTGDQMERMGITSFEEVAYAAPNLNLTPYPSSASRSEEHTSELQS